MNSCRQQASTALNTAKSTRSNMPSGENSFMRLGSPIRKRANPRDSFNPKQGRPFEYES